MTDINQTITWYTNSETLIHTAIILTLVSALVFINLYIDPIDDNSIHAKADEIGGGEKYTDKICGENADIVLEASSGLSNLREALSDSSSGDIVFIEPDAQINLGFDEDSSSIEVSEEVTLASDRGCEGSEGALLTSEAKKDTNWEGSDTIKMNDDSRITGLRIEGPYPDREMNWLREDHDYTDGVVAQASGVEINNNEIYGWPAAAVRGGLLHVHHNYIHDNDQSGLGYGVSSTDEGSVIEYNRFERNRHAIAGSGEEGKGYIARFNTFGSEGIGGAGHKIDMHEDGNTGKAGSKIEVYRNTIRYPDAQAVYIRGAPRENSKIYDNWFFNSNEPCLSENEIGGGYCAIRLTADDWSKLEYSGNHYGSSEPECGIGAPRKGC